MRTLAISLLLLSALAAPAFAQPEADSERPRKYVPFPVDPNFEALLKNRLQLEKQLGALKDLVKQIKADPGKFKVDPQMLKDMKLDDPHMKRLIKEWSERDPEMKEALQEWLKQNPKVTQAAPTEEFQKTLKSILDQPGPNIPPPVNDPPPIVKPIELPESKEDALAKITERAMKNAEQTKLGDWLRDSPAWKGLLEDLQESLHNSRAADWGLSKWKHKLGLSNEKAWKLGEGLLDRLRDLPRPKLENWKVDFKIPALGKMPAAPNINAPALPNVATPSLPSMSQGLTWLLFGVLFALIAWQMYRWTKRGADGDDARAALGPWPILPEAVATRAELVQAFDYLALLTLGLDVRSWNHQAVAKRWSETKPACTVVAVALARLYELARYTDGAGSLSDGQRDEARRSLRHLAEAF